jgi:hypothetical protein
MNAAAGKIVQFGRLVGQTARKRAKITSLPRLLFVVFQLACCVRQQVIFLQPLRRSEYQRAIVIPKLVFAFFGLPFRKLILVFGIS